MLDLRFIRENIDLVRQAIANRQDTAPLDEILELDRERRQKVLELEGLRRTRKEAGRERKMAEETLEQGRLLRARIRTLEEAVRNLDNQLEELLLQVPNIPSPAVPVGVDEGDNVVMRWGGEPQTRILVYGDKVPPIPNLEDEFSVVALEQFII